MSGFGAFGQQNASGFGTPAPNSGFGQSPATNTPAFGSASGFTDATSSNFGGVSNNSTGFANTQNNSAAPFGTPAKSAFGSTGVGIGGTTGFAGFGSTPNSNSGFGGASTMGFGNATNAPAGFGSAPAPSGFGSASDKSSSTEPAAPLTFGSSSTVVFGSSATIATAPSGFGSGFGQTTANNASSSSGFGQADTTSSGFGQVINPASNQTGFGQTSNAAPKSSGFGGFGQTNNPASNQTSFGVSSGFGQTSIAASASSSMFGQANSQSSNQPVFGQTSATVPTSSGFTQANNTTSNQPSFGFKGSSSSNDDKPTLGFGTSSTASTPFFGKSAQSQSHNDDSMQNNDSMDDSNVVSSPFNQRIPRKERKSDPTSQSPMDAPLASSRTTEGDEQLAALRAKIQEKRNKLLKMKMGNQSNESNKNSDLKDTTESSVPPTSLSNSELAAKNALRFAGNNLGQTTSKLLPTDLQGPARQEEESSSDVNTRDIATEEDEDIDVLRTLSGAKDLIGVCRSMCPDEELLRREREGDIQLLEITDPGGLHPETWTLRDTAVKRFRRSAADFKLDIPDLVRPPDVLERVCGYLEEWVMERDRQGPDKRFSQQPSIVPPPLDVYQFIWDRTRMIRKDFILQNYIGDGGKCDARAVRCHERIARWHAMCEHQLSHIQEFITHQSQQNIAELGQTMKTLNLYYDDALGRSLNEEAGDSIEEYHQGCASNIVEGKSPVDFDGSDLSNSSTGSDVSKRIIGANGMESPTRGTAEPEMRGLYILLTMNNEGGMEVIKYSGRLCTQRPEIFYSKPVQLALSIFQARKDHNYAKFFHLLRSPSTPYLFSCIMFKYVEQMRKTALMIMSRTYGAKHKTTGQSFYDEYPLENLVKLLCFEDEDEARAACMHYGITLEGNIIRWRNSKFAEPRDPDKGIILTLKPKKMMRTIECKLGGATRLSVCRGGVSGEGATLSATSRTSVSAEQAKKNSTEEKARQQQQQRQLMLEQQKQQQQQQQEEARLMEVAKKEAERKRLQVIAEERRAKQLENEEREAKAREEKERIKQEDLRIKREKEEALMREAREREQAIRRAEEEKRELARQRMIEKQRKELELKQRLENEARRKAEEEQKAKRQAEVEKQRLIAYNLEKQRLAEEERIRKERQEEERIWQLKIENARKILVWSLWLKQVRKNRSPTVVLESIDPTVTCGYRPATRSMPSRVYKRANVGMNNQNFESHLYQLATASRKPCIISQIVANEFWKSPARSIVTSSKIPFVQPMVLFKLSVVLPQRHPENDNIMTSLATWVDSHLRFNEVTKCTSDDRFRSHSIRVHAVSTIANQDTQLCRDCDAALFLLPLGDTTLESRTKFPDEVLDSLPDNVPRMILLIGDAESNANYPTNIVDDVLGPVTNSDGSSHQRKGVVTPEMNQLDSTFRNCCEALVGAFLKTARDQPITRISLSKLSSLCLERMLENLSLNGSLLQFASPEDEFHTLHDYSMTALASMVNELRNLFERIECNKESIWPAQEFISKNSKSVENYFDNESSLPCDWYKSLQDISLFEEKVFGPFQFMSSPNLFASFVTSTAQNLSDSYQQQHLLNMLDEANIAGCLSEVLSLVANGQVIIDCEEMPTLYLPAAKLLAIIEHSGYCEAPIRPQAQTPEDIPAFLYNDQPVSYTREVNATTTSNSMEKQITPSVMHKRKPSDGILTLPSKEQSNKKRMKTVEPNRVESEDMQDSKDFTSYLEALLR